LSGKWRRGADFDSAFEGSSPGAPTSFYIARSIAYKIVLVAKAAFSCRTGPRNFPSFSMLSIFDKNSFRQDLACFSSSLGAVPGPKSLPHGSSHCPLHRCKTRRLHQYQNKPSQFRVRKAAPIGRLLDISSAALNIDRLANSVRGHWGVESMHPPPRRQARHEGQDRLRHLPGNWNHRLPRSWWHARKRPGHGSARKPAHNQPLRPHRG
jgi:hypothetical protein